MMRRILGGILLVPGAWALIAPQANLGLPELRWMARSSFPGEALVGAVIVGLAYYLIGQVPTGAVGRIGNPESSISAERDGRFRPELVRKLKT
jgi:hypothetical protein